jgi:acyl transferase domain-containing protein/NADP-dependent 3-hydroxy acid dehydrogenase YdfG
VIVQRDDIAIIGMGCLFPGAASLGEYWQNVKDGIDCITEIPATHWRPDDYFDADKKAPDKTYARRGGFLSPYPFNPLAFGISPNAIEATDSSQLLGMVVAQQALEDAGYGETATFDRDRVSCVLGVTGALPLVIPLGARLGHPIWRRALEDAGVDKATADDVVARISDSYVGWQEASFPGLLGNVVAGRIANRLNLGGTNCVIDAACASSLGAIHLSMLELHAGRADMVVTGGVDTFNDIFMYTCFSKTPALSPTGNAKPFARDADGTILGEGVGCVILKRLADARRDGDRIYAVVKAIGSSSDGRGQAIYAPKGEGQAKALRIAYAEAGFSPSTVELVEAHGTGTSVGDAVELTALKTVFRESREDGAWCGVGSVKSQIGHTKAAAGAAGLIKAALALHHRVQPPTAKITEPAEGLEGSPFHAIMAPRPWVRGNDHPRRAGVSAFGFGGSNFHCVLEEAPLGGERPALRTGGDVQIVAYSGPDGRSIAQGVTEDANVLASGAGEWNAVRALAGSRRRVFDSVAAARLCVVVKRGDDVSAVLKRVVAMLAEDKAHWQTPDGACFDRRPPHRAVAALFPGQGAQYVGMLRDVACIADPMIESLDLAESLARENGADSYPDGLGTLIYPLAPAADATDRLMATAVAQPAIAAVSAGLLKTLRTFDLPIMMSAGHSVGELAALFAAGVFSEADFIRVSMRRGALMSPRADGVERGGMLAIAAGRRTAGVALSAAEIDVTLANDNAPKQVVISGRRSKIIRAAAVFAESGVTTTPLSVSAGFHSPLVADAEAPFRASLEDVAVNSPTFPVIANLTAEPYPAGPDAIRSTLARQLVSPVRFVESVRAMYDAGARVFLEIGPGRRVSGLAGAILKDAQDVSVISCDASNGKGSGVLDLARALALVAARGVPVSLAVWDDGFVAPPHGTAMTVPISGANSFKPKEKRPPTPPRVAAASAAAPAAMQPAQLPALAGEITPFTSSPASMSSSPESLALVRESILALQTMQQQAAEAHRQFLEGHAVSQKLFFELIARQLGGPSTAMVVQSPNEVALPTAPTAIIPAASRVDGPARPAAVPSPAPASVSPVAAPVVSPPTALPSNGAAQGATSAAASVASMLLEIVSEKTGYPTDMLNVGMSLEWDLGIDSIKRVEIFSEVQARTPAAKNIRAEDLTRLRTLQEIVDLLSRGSESPSSVTPTPSDAPTEDASAAAVAAVLGVVTDKTGYPAEMLNLEMTLEWDLGIDSIKRVEILSELQARFPDARKVDSQEMAKIRTLGHIVALLKGESQATPQEASAMVQEALAASPVTPRTANSSAGIDRLIVVTESLSSEPTQVLFPSGDAAFLLATVAGDPLTSRVAERLTDAGFAPQIVDLTTPDVALPPTLQGCVILAPEETQDARALTLAAFTLLQRASASLKAGDTPVFATVTRSGGSFGLDGIDSESTALLAGLAGLSKTASHEWPSVRCLTIDLDPALSVDEVAVRLAAEVRGDGSGEIGLGPAGRVGLRLEIEPIAAAHPHALEAERLAPGDLVVVTGGGRGVTAAVIDRLATALRPTLLVLARSPLPEPEPSWLDGVSSEGSIKAAIARSASAPLTPRELQAEFDRLMAARELRRNLERFRAAGATVLYESVDVRDTEAVGAIVGAAVEMHGPVRAVVHGAGVIADKLIEDKPLAAFAAVYDTKIGGLAAVLRAVDPKALRALILFSSSTARFGRKGQVDYAVANEALNKLAQYCSVRLPACRVLSLNWGPWDGGMVSRGLKSVFQNEGIDVIGLDDGANYLLAELRNDASDHVEIVVLGRQTESGVAAAGSLAAPRAAAGASLAAPSADMPPVFEMTIDVASYPVLEAHVLGGHAVVPAALLIEWLALGAVQRNPGLRLVELSDFKVLKGIRLTADGRVTLRCYAAPPALDGDDVVDAVEIRSVSDGRELAHARALARLSMRAAEPQSPAHPRIAQAYAKDVPRAYDEDLFHGELLRGITRVYGASPNGISARIAGGGEPSSFQHAPLRSTWITQPLAIDCCFQLAVLWSTEHLGAPCLPSAVGHYTQFQSDYPATGCDANLIVRTQAPGKLVADVELVDDDGRLIARLEGFEATVDSSLKAAFALSRLTPAAAL